MPKLESGITDKINRFFFQKLTSDLLIISNKLIKFLVPSSNSFRDILLTKFHYGLLTYNAWDENGAYIRTTSPTELKKKKKKKKKSKKRICLFSILIPYIKFQDPLSDRSWPHAKRDEQMNERTAQKLRTSLNLGT